MPEIVLCIASGPSLRREDIDAVRPLVDATVCVANTWEHAPDAEYVYDEDLRWWRYHYRAVSAGFRGAMVTSNDRAAREFGIRLSVARGRNSGIGGFLFALSVGARRVYLLGYDFKRGPDGQQHYFGRHPAHMPATSTKTYPVWCNRMREIATGLRGVEVINLTRDTALDCFPRGEIA